MKNKTTQQNQQVKQEQQQGSDCGKGKGQNKQ